MVVETEGGAVKKGSSRYEKSIGQFRFCGDRRMTDHAQLLWFYVGAMRPKTA